MPFWPFPSFCGALLSVKFIYGVWGSLARTCNPADCVQLFEGFQTPFTSLWTRLWIDRLDRLTGWYVVRTSTLRVGDGVLAINGVSLQDKDSTKVASLLEEADQRPTSVLTISRTVTSPATPGHSGIIVILFVWKLLNEQRANCIQNSAVRASYIEQLCKALKCVRQSRIVEENCPGDKASFPGHIELQINIRQHGSAICQLNYHRFSFENLN